MTSVGLDDSRELLSGWEDRLGRGGDGRRNPSGTQAVTSTEGKIVRASDHQHRAFEVALRRQAADGQQLTEGDGLLRLLSKGKHAGVVMGWVEEEELVAVDVPAGQVSQAVLRGRVVFCTLRNHRVELGLVEVGAGEEIRQVRGVHGEAGQSDRVCNVRVLGRHGVGQRRAERVAHVDDLLGVRVHAFAQQGAIAQHSGQLGEDFDFEE